MGKKKEKQRWMVRDKNTLKRVGMRYYNSAEGAEMGMGILKKAMPWRELEVFTDVYTS